MLMASLMTAVYTDEPQQVQGCKGCLDLVAEDLLDTNDYRGHCLHCRREITAQDGQEAVPALWEGLLVTNSRALRLALSKRLDLFAHVDSLRVVLEGLSG